VIILVELSNIPLINKIISTFFLIFLRISTTVMTIPIIGTSMTPGRVKVGLAGVIAIFFYPKSQIIDFELMSIEGLIAVVNQFMIGCIIGFILQIVFQIFITVGQIISMQVGLGFAVMNDPSSNSSIPIVSEFYLILASLIFFAFDGHLAILNVIDQSFTLIPIEKDINFITYFLNIVKLGAWVFSYSLKIVIPAITILLMINICFGIIAKAAPQLNLFSLGFPITMILGMFVIWFHLNNTNIHLYSLINGINSVITNFLRGV